MYCEHALRVYKQRQSKDITTQDGEIGEKVILLRKKGLKVKQNNVKFVPDVTECELIYFELHHGHYFFIAVVQKKKQPS